MELVQTLGAYLLHVDTHLFAVIQTYGQWVYALLFFIIFFETACIVTPFLPGDSLLFAAGAIATDGSLNIYFLVPLLFCAATLGDTVNYSLGNQCGLRLFKNPSSRFFQRRFLTASEAFYERHGGKAIILSRFAPILRTFAPFIAGMSRMRYTTFVLYNLLGGLLWVVGFTTAGYAFGHIPFLKRELHWFIIAILLFSSLPGFVVLLKRKEANFKAH